MDRKHALGGQSIVIDGWHLRPERVVQLGLANIFSSWIVPKPAVLEYREKHNSAWFQKSPDPDRMFNNFLARSLWHNQLILDQAKQFQLPVLSQDGETSVDELCHLILNGFNVE